MVREAESAQGFWGGAFRNANDTEAARATAPSPGGQSRGPRGVANGQSLPAVSSRRTILPAGGGNKKPEWHPRLPSRLPSLASLG